MGHRSPGGICHFSQISKVLLYPWPLWATSRTHSHSPLLAPHIGVLGRFTLSFPSQASQKSFKNIVRFLITRGFYDHHKLRKRNLKTKKMIQDLFSCCFLLSSSKRIVFSVFKTHLLSSGWSYRKNKIVLESPGNKESDYVIKTFLWCLWRNWWRKISDDPRFSVYDEIGCRWAWSCGWVRGLWHISGHTAQGEYVNFIPQGDLG